jgi:hypothetical protein
MHLQKVKLVTYLNYCWWRDIIEVEKEQGGFKKSKCYVRHVRQQEEPIMRKLAFSFFKIVHSFDSVRVNFHLIFFNQS